MSQRQTLLPTGTEVTLSDGVRVHAETGGDPDAPLTIVLLHGWTLDVRCWHRTLGALAGRLTTRARIVAYDARGHGRSDATPLDRATLGRLGDDLREVLDELAPTGRVILCGHSMGGMTIMEYAHRHPEHFASRIAGLVLVSTSAEGTSRTHYGLPDRLATLFRLAETTGAGVLARCGTWRPHRAVLPVLGPAIRWLLYGDRCEGADLRLTLSSVGRCSLRAIGGFRTSIGMQQRLDTLSTLGDVPAAVLAGSDDRLTPPACAEAIADALPGTELTLCPGGGHMLMLERPSEVATALAAVTNRAAMATPLRAPGRHSRRPSRDVSPGATQAA
ncbi:alpha/beta fold hydrolase [Catenuloplanes atrovinosus]|uniref:Pimeloyl-ACP methyl ester carboxylesterase n=1 Tax=Catenuloplanes atrovinosus TaxID=137266 RepID=A0AAE3YR46_9ACTN|nr:alpha/beta hydrolase [Catenuloplanes atrovinosus]MDR7278453.1 pimeloyl-ACP methyl ester carboxylesterase [Catenuloplanes atrovinosus]